MKKLITSLMVLGLCLSPYAVSAKIYQWTDSDGKTHFSDKPHKGAKVVNLKPVQTYNPAKVANLKDVHQLLYGKDRKPGQMSSGEVKYDSVTITQPKNDAPVRSNNGAVTFNVNTQPALEHGHDIGIYVDGSLSTKASSSTVTVNNLDRGTHTAYAVVLNGYEEELARSGEVTFHLLRRSKLHVQAGKQPSNLQVKAFIKNVG